ncbi:MAG: hypothetical protein U0903_03280 [Planctomycetales bacterium]
MLTLDYRLSPHKKSNLLGFDLSSVDEIALRYDLFLGDIIFQIDQCDLSAKWNWIPVVDFVAGLIAIGQSLNSGSQREVFEFTESDACLTFVKNEFGELLISASYAACIAKLSLREFVEKVNDFAARFESELTSAYPALLHNSHFKKCVSKIG